MSKELPVFFTKKTSLEKNLIKFLDHVENVTFLNETENEKIGLKYVKDAEKTLDLNEMLKNIEDHGTDKTVSLITIAEEEGLSGKEIFKLIMDSITIEPTSGFGGENYVFAVPVKTEIDVDLKKFPGKLDTVKYPDIYSELIKLLDEKTVEKILAENSNHIENNKMTVSIPQYYWAGIIDEEKLKDNLVKAIDVSEQEIEQLIKVG